MFKNKIAGLLSCVVLLSAPAAFADLYTFSTTDASGSITTSAANGGEVIITLTDLVNNPTSAASLISGIDFTLSGTITSDAIGTGANAPSGNLITINSSTGVYTTDTTDHIDQWATNHSGSKVCLSAIALDNCAPGGGVADLIIGQPNGSNKYSNANPSISNHDPDIMGPATFTLLITGVTANTAVSAVTVYFGTQSGTGDSHEVPTNLKDVTVNQTSTATPEPSSLMLLGTGLAGAVGMLRRRLS